MILSIIGVVNALLGFLCLILHGSRKVEPKVKPLLRGGSVGLFGTAAFLLFLSLVLTLLT